MSKNSSKSLIAILLVLVVPVVGYGIFQLNSLTADERELATIYKRQLESVLFSVNQTVQDKSDEIFSKVLKPDGDYSFDEIKSLLGQYPFFRAHFVMHIDSEDFELYALQEDYYNDDFTGMVKSLLVEKQDAVNRLLRYIQDGDFQKVQSFDDFAVFNEQVLDYLFFITEKNTQFFINIYFFDARLFIEQNLGPKFQELAQGDFIITCNQKSDGWTVYSTSGEITSEIESESLDLLPRFEVGIAREGGTVQEAVDRRLYQNLIALGLLMLVLVIGVWLVFRNIRREMELAQKKADFVSNVSHEIRTPLALINMFAETLLMGRVRTEEKKIEYYEIITKEVSRLTNMINRILSFSKMEADKREYRMHTVSLPNIVREVHNTYSYHLENNGFDHDLECTDKELMIQADQEAIIEVLVNLIDNGMKYSTEEKHISIRCGEEIGMAYVEVADRGMGIAKDQINKLFEKFYRVPTGDVHDTKGSGLGLTLVKHIVEAHNGKIEVKSKLGEGSAFRIFFPIEELTHV